MRVINLIKTSIISKAQSPESKAFFEKMIGDYYRYIAESAKGSRLQEVSDAALEFYQKASTTSE